MFLFLFLQNPRLLKEQLLTPSRYLGATTTPGERKEPTVGKRWGAGAGTHQHGSVLSLAETQQNW